MIKKEGKPSFFKEKVYKKKGIKKMNNKNIAENIWQKIDYAAVEKLEKNNDIDYKLSIENYIFKIWRLLEKGREEKEIIKEIQGQVLNYYKKLKNDMDLLEKLKKLESKLLYKFTIQDYLYKNIKEILSTFKDLDLKKISINDTSKYTDKILIDLKNEYFAHVIIAYDFFNYDEEYDIRSFVIRFINLDLREYNFINNFIEEV